MAGGGGEACTARESLGEDGGESGRTRGGDEHVCSPCPEGGLETSPSGSMASPARRNPTQTGF